MNKRFMEFVLPFHGKSDLVNSHFLKRGRIYLGGFPVGSELPEGELSSHELRELGFEEAFRRLELDNGACRLFGTPEFALDPPSASLNKFYSEEGELVGWNFAFKLTNE